MTAAPRSIAAVVRGLHHVAIAVESLEASRGTYEQALGLAAGEVENVPEQRVNVLMLRAGSQKIELVEPAGAGSPITGFLARRGSGIHHLAWEVADVAAAIAALKTAGVQMIDEAPRRGAHGTRIAFVHPRSTGGVLMELVEDPSAG